MATDPSHSQSQSHPASASATVLRLPKDETTDERIDRELLSGLYTFEASPAYKSLDVLAKKGTVAPARIEALLRRYHGLYQHMLTAVEYEKFIVKKTRCLQSDVARQKLEVEKASSKAYDDNAEISELRRELLRIQNELFLTQERVDGYQREQSEHLATRDRLVEDIEELRRHKIDMLEPQLNATTKDIKMLLLQRRQHNDILSKEIEEREAVHERATRERERLLSDREATEKTFAKLSELPMKLRKQIDVLHEAVASLRTESKKLEQGKSALETELEALVRRRRGVDDEKDACEHELASATGKIADTEKFAADCEAENKHLGLSIAALHAQGAALRATIAKAEAATRDTHDQFLRRTHEKDALVKGFRKLESQCNATLARMPGAKQHHRDIVLDLAAAQRDLTRYRKTIRGMIREKDSLINTLLTTETTASKEHELREIHVQRKLATERELEVVEKKLSECERDLAQRKHERELRTRELLRLQSKLRKLRDGAHHTEIVLTDVRKITNDAQTQFGVFVSQNDAVKGERNRLVTLISGAQQRVLEMKEKSRILRSEVEILRSEVELRSRKLAQQRQFNVAAYSRRDISKMEANRLHAQYREKRGYVEEQAGRIDTLSSSLDTIASEIASLKSRFEQVVSERNRAGIKHLERNDELCMLYEKKNSYELKLKSGEEAQQQLDARQRELQLIHKEMERALMAKRKQVPEVEGLRGEYASLRQQIQQAKTRIEELTIKTESPNEDRVRALRSREGKLSLRVLDDKVRGLEARLSETEERLVEKALVREEMHALTERLRKQTEAGRGDSTEAQGRLNAITKRLQRVSKASMAVAAETSMARRVLTGVELELESRRGYLERLRGAVASHRMWERGTTVDGKSRGPIIILEELETEWRRQEAQRTFRMRVSGGDGDGDGHGYGHSDGYRPHDGNSKAGRAHKRRPNAYMPQEEGALPVARPYGGEFGPFSNGSGDAGEGGASVSGRAHLKRFYRKPAIAPVEF